MTASEGRSEAAVGDIYIGLEVVATAYLASARIHVNRACPDWERCVIFLLVLAV